jgi:lipid-A-disaccharide synthase
MSKPLLIGIVAGEVSGDNLGAGLITEIRRRLPNVSFVGIGGPRMRAAGLNVWYPVDELSVMGLEVIRKLGRILKLRREIIKNMKEEQIDLFIGIDAPDFNLSVEESLHAAGIKTVHYVSPSVWAWRQNRVYKIKRAVDHVLCLLPFEKRFYDEYEVPATFVGHTMADLIPLDTDRNMSRRMLNLNEKSLYLAVLPGSRTGEIRALSPVFLKACQILKKDFINLKLIVPMVNSQLKDMFSEYVKKYGEGLDITTFVGHSREVMSAADAVLLSSGTATLEAMLIGRPMVVAYKLSKIAEMIARRLIKIDVVSLPNLLIDRKPVPELLQDDCTPEKLAAAVSRILKSDNQELLEDFRKAHVQLIKNADELAAEVCISVINSDGA